MPFTPVNELLPNPTVKVFFSGLMIMKPSANNKTCEVYVHRSAPDHHLSIDVRQKRPNKPDVFLMRHLGPLAFAEAVPGAPTPVVYGFLVLCDAPQGVKKYQGAPLATGERGLSPHAFNLSHYHSGKTNVHEPGARPGLFFNDGVFYSADVTPPEVKIELKKGGAVVYELSQLAAMIGANIYNRKVTLRWNQNGIIETLVLEPKAGVSYEVHITNDPLYEPPETVLDRHDELGEYYKILPAVDTQERYTLEFTYPTTPPQLVSAKRDDRGSTMIPCMPTIDDA